ncbi:MAG: hypothetical protein GXO36_03615, partial [Chloroflexi bacterium]|nr:hypothetical protein [Chloroflexota bacterium]
FPPGWPEEFKHLLQAQQPALHSMTGVTVGDLLALRDKLDYEYDYTATTTLRIQARARYQGPRPDSDPQVRVLSRNFKPQVECALCGRPAQYLASNATVGPYVALCAQHAGSHGWRYQRMHRLVNSPRTGLCQYHGPMEARYAFERFAPAHPDRG